MKIGTDGILLGAWANAPQPRRILDIGTGTGLLALMLAQRFPHATITGIEIDGKSAHEAARNARHSSFAERIRIVHTSVQAYAKIATDGFDLIVSNPPFFEHGEVRNTARHSHTLPHETLIRACKKLLAPHGQCCYILPKVEGEKFIDLAERYDLYLSEKINVQSKPDKAITRLLLRFTDILPKAVQHETLTIEKATPNRAYTAEYVKLTKDFYLKM